MDNANIVLVGLSEKVRSRIPLVDGQVYGYPFPQIPSIGEEILLLDATPALHLLVKNIGYDFDIDGSHLRTRVCVDFATAS